MYVVQKKISRKQQIYKHIITGILFLGDLPPNGIPDDLPIDDIPIDKPTLAPEVLSGPGPLITWLPCSKSCGTGVSSYVTEDCEVEPCSTTHIECNTMPCIG